MEEKKTEQLKKYAARFLLNFSVADLRDMLTGRFILVFDDGQCLEVDAAETCYSARAWDIHRHWIRTPLLATHHLQYYLKDKTFGDTQDREYVSAIVNSALDTYGPEIDIAEIKKMSYDIQNDNYNDAIVITASDVHSIDLADFYELYNHPEIKEAREYMLSMLDKSSDQLQLIESTQHRIKKIMLNSESLSNNILAASSRNGNMKTNQVLHCNGPIGPVHDADGAPFNKAIVGGFYNGISNLADAIAASREPTVSIGNNNKTIQDTQYFSRSNNLNVNSFGKLLKNHDCGTKLRMPWVIDEKGRDLKLMDGTEYVDEAGEVGWLSPEKVHLAGKLVYIRTLFGCMVEEPATVCAACYGRAARVVPDNSNVSVTPTAELGDKLTSSVLALKHDQVVSITNALDSLSIEQQTFFKVFPDKRSLGFKDGLKTAQEFKLYINASECETLASLGQVGGFADIQISANSAVQKIVLEINGLFYPIDVGTEKQPAFLTREFFEYAAGVTISKNNKEVPENEADDEFDAESEEEEAEEEIDPVVRVEHNGASHMEIDEHQRYVIDMSDWDFNLSFVETSSRGSGLLGLKMKVMAILQSSASYADARDTRSAALAALIRLYEILNTAGSYSFPVVQTIVYGASIESHAERKYGLPKPWTKAGIGVASEVTKRRDLGNALAYEEQRTMLTDPTSYLIPNRPDNAYAALFVPGRIFGGKDKDS